MLFNKINFIDFVFLKRSQNKYTFKIFGTTQLKLRDSNEIKEGFIQIMPLEVNFTQNFAKYLMENPSLDEIRRTKHIVSL